MLYYTIGSNTLSAYKNLIRDIGIICEYTLASPDLKYYLAKDTIKTDTIDSYRFRNFIQLSDLEFVGQLIASKATHKVCCFGSPSFKNYILSLRSDKIIKTYSLPQAFSGNEPRWYYFFYKDCLCSTYEYQPEDFKVVDWKEMIDINFKTPKEKDLDIIDLVECERTSSIIKSISKPTVINPIELKLSTINPINIIL